MKSCCVVEAANSVSKPMLSLSTMGRSCDRTNVLNQSTGNSLVNDTFHS
jgi:hypothetical protein